MSKPVSRAFCELHNLIHAAEHHRKNCHHSDCNVSLHILRWTAERLALICNVEEFDEAKEMIEKTEWW